MRVFLTMFIAFVLLPAASFADTVALKDYSKRILGRWLGSRKYEIFHADGRWGVLRNEESSEDIRGRRWRIKDQNLILTYPGDHGMETGVYTIISFTSKAFVTEIDGHKEEFDRSP